MRQCLACVLCLFIANVAFGQRYVSRYDAFEGFSYFASPNINLYQRGFNSAADLNLRRWLALVGDFSILTGGNSITPGQLSAAQQMKLAPMLPLLPPGYVASVPYEAKTYTYGAGPQFNYRRLKRATLFVRPAGGIVHQCIVAKPRDAIQSTLVAALLPTGKINDTVLFYGGGTGFDINASNHVGIRVAADFVHINLFHGFLKEGQNVVRVSVGPTFRFGSNMR